MGQVGLNERGRLLTICAVVSFGGLRQLGPKTYIWAGPGPYIGSGGGGFLCAAALVGHLIDYGMLGHNLVRRHLVKPLTHIRRPRGRP